MSLSIGEQLKQAREKRGLTLEQAAKSTHIRKFYLEALENNQREELPSVVQGRGFLRLYAGLLDLPTEPLLADWDGKPVELAPDSLESSAPLLEHSPESIQSEQEPASISAPAAVLAEQNLLSTETDPETLPLPDLRVNDHDVPATGSRLIFQEIGEKLRLQRDALGLSTTEVERYTRLRTFYIQALEEGRIDDLPSPVQGRGMLSNYAAFLNMDEERLLLRFAEGLQARRIERLPKLEPQGMFNAKKRPARYAPFWKRFLTPDLIFGIGMAGIILFFALWTASRINSMRTAEVQPTAPAISEILLNPDTTRTGTPGTPEPGIEETPGDPLAPIDAPEDPAQPGTVVAGDPINPLPAMSETPSGTATLPPINEDPLQVYIVARQRAYLRVLADDNVEFLGRVVPGNAYAFSADRRIEISTGNAGALQVFYNQIDLGILGSSGEVSNLVFSIEGVYTPTPAFTATPTPTKPATLTPLPSPTLPATPTITPFVP